jgi:hypothetical protein
VVAELKSFSVVLSFFAYADQQNAWAADACEVVQKQSLASFTADITGVEDTLNGTLCVFIQLGG